MSEHIVFIKNGTKVGEIKETSEGTEETWDRPLIDAMNRADEKKKRKEKTKAKAKAKKAEEGEENTNDTSAE